MKIVPEDTTGLCRLKVVPSVGLMLKIKGSELYAPWLVCSAV